MKRILSIIFILFGCIKLPAYCTTFIGEVTKVGLQESNQIIDSNTKQPIDSAKISIPDKKYHTYSDGNGNFTLPEIKITQPMIVKVEKEGYRPFSLTITSEQSLKNPLKIAITRSEPADISLDTDLLHLGDNSFSQNSANAKDFRLKSIGPYYSKEFIMTENAKQSTNYLIIGSILGLDTKLAQQMGQNKIKTGAYSSPAEIYFNEYKIGEIKINGDGQRVKIPSSLIKADTKNQITIKTGQNMTRNDRIDYDDIEIANLSILSE